MQGTPGYFPELSPGQNAALFDYTDFCDPVTWPTKITQFKGAAAAPLMGMLSTMRVTEIDRTDVPSVMKYAVRAATLAEPPDELTDALAHLAPGYALLAPKEFDPDPTKTWVFILTNDIKTIQDNTCESCAHAVISPIATIPDCGGGDTTTTTAPKAKSIWPWVAGAAGVGIIAGVLIANKDT